jgi:hypothetical protein
MPMLIFTSFLFAEEEATALIGTHSIGMTRHTFGASLAAPVRNSLFYLPLH